MAKQFLVSIDLSKNELQNFVIHTLAAAPVAPPPAMAYFNSGTNKFMMYIGGAWVDITGKVTVITSSTAALTIDLTDPTAPDLTIADASGVNSGLLTSAFYNDLTNATALNTAGTIVKRDASGDIAVSELTAAVVTGLLTPVNPSDAVNKSYVDSLVASGVKIVGSIDASTNPDYPAATVGQAWKISVGGLIGGASGEVVENGDLVICVVASAGGDQATVGTDFIILQDNTEQATETVAGYAEVATTAETTTGTDDSRFITPLKLAQRLSSFGSGNASHAQGNIGDGTNTLLTFNHNLGNQYCTVQVFDAVSDLEVEADINQFDAYNVKIGFNVAPTSNQYRVVCTG